jgi:hypothetical protein
VPDLYRRITRAYSRLRSDTLVQGEYYKAESDPEVYRFDQGKLTLQPTAARRAAVVVIPDEFVRL